MTFVANADTATISRGVKIRIGVKELLGDDLGIDFARL
jgi:hypothetical protein